MAVSCTDRQLLWRYLSEESEEAFEALVRRHADLVFSSILRRVGNEEAARELAQSVFVALARKAWRLSGEVSLAAWLHKAAVFEARRWWREELRRQRREQAAINLGTTMKDDASPLESMSPELDEGLLELGQAERQAVMLRYFENLSHREVGTRLGVGEDAARKRIDKGLAHLTGFFRRRGYTVPTAAATALVMSRSVRAAPDKLASMAGKAACAVSCSASLGVLGLLAARFLAMRNIQATAIAVFLCAAPVGHQWLRQKGEKAREGELRGRWAELEADRRDLERLVAELEARLRSTESLAASWGSGSNAEANLYIWDDSDYVRVPKKLLARLQFGDPGFNPPAGPASAIAQDGTPAPVLLDALGLTGLEAEKVTELCRGVASDYFALVAPRCYVTNTGENFNLIVQSPPSGFQKTNSDCVTWVVPSLGTEGEVLRERLRKGLAGFLDEERMAVFFNQTSNQILGYFNAFGEGSRQVTLYRPSPGATAMAFKYGDRVTKDGWTMFQWRGAVPEALEPFAGAWQRQNEEAAAGGQQP